MSLFQIIFVLCLIMGAYGETVHPYPIRRPKNSPGQLLHDTRTTRKIVRQNMSKSTKDNFARQPHLGLKNLVKYDSSDKNFHRRSPTSLHIRAAPVKTNGAPWPMPKKYSADSTKRFIIEPNILRVYVKDYYNDILEFNLKRLWQHVFEMEYKPLITLLSGSDLIKLRRTPGKYGLIKLLNITIIDASESSIFPTSLMDETYSLSLRSGDVIDLVCREVWGAIRGLETLSQLMIKDKNQYYISDITIHDSPRFSHRGLMIDTARHFISKRLLIENLEAMAQNKLNVFHWHMTDDQSFPFDSHKLPNITKYGAYNPETHIYRHSDVADVINAARLRGIRVIPEFDTPGHSFSWGFGQPGLLTLCFYNDGKPNKYFGPIDPISELSYQVIGRLYREILEVFPDNTVHIGGDEVSRDCWETNPTITSYINRTGLSLDAILGKFSARLQDMIAKLTEERQRIRTKKTSREAEPEIIAWQEAFDESRKLANDTIVQIWKEPEYYVEHVVDSGYKAIFSSCWYLDGTTYGIDWDVFYNCMNKGVSHPTDYGGKLIGGEVCLWTEFVNDNTITSKLWPRASAAAERLWSPVDVSDFQDAAPRLEEQNCRMRRFGIPSGVLNGPSFCGETLIKSPPFNMTWTEFTPTTGKHHLFFHQKLGESLKRSSPTQASVKVIIIFVGLLGVILSAFICCLCLIFCALLCPKYRCTKEFFSLRKLKCLLNRRVITVVLCIGSVVLTANIIRLSPLTKIKHNDYSP